MIEEPLTLLSARGFFSFLNTAYILLIHRQESLNNIISNQNEKVKDWKLQKCLGPFSMKLLVMIVGKVRAEKAG